MDVSEIGEALVTAVTGGLRPEIVVVPASVGPLQCRIWGDSGDPVVLVVHGNGGLGLWWAPLVAALVPGWRVVAPDLRGHGESAWAEPPSYRMEDFAGDLDSIGRALALGRVPIVGHSMGGRIAAWYALHRAAAVRGLAVLDTRFDPVDAAVVAQYRSLAAGTRQGRGYPSRDAAMAAFRFVPDEDEVPAAVVRMLAWHAVHERAPGDWTFRFDRAVLSLDGDGAGDLRPTLPDIACPTWVVGGANSWVCDAAQRSRIAGAMRHVTTTEFPGGHHFLLTHGAAVGHALRQFLDRLA